MTVSRIVIIGAVLIAFVLSCWFYPQMPDRIASHWNAQGQVDGYTSKTLGLFLMPGMMAGLALLFALIPRIAPHKANIERFRRYYDGFVVVFLLFLLALHYFIILWNLGFHIGLNRILPVGIALLFFYSGVLCRNAKRNFFVGIRTPWTLSSDIVWEKTHRLGGRLFKIAAFVVGAGAFFPNLMLYFLLVPVLSITVFLLIYSYIEYRKDEPYSHA
ncbi:MAG: DUF1648 domain-containing protein [Phycisphaerales bacterium]|jgi:uncharacterized membrane protein